jgi:SAM-dependent methyltransferase
MPQAQKDRIFRRISMSDVPASDRPAEAFYTEKGGFLRHDPSWCVGDSAWKASHILEMISRHALAPKRVCDVGCGAGEVLRQLHDRLPEQDATFVGYEISPHALELAHERESARLSFKLGDLAQDDQASFDLLLLIDVIEHVEDPFDFLRRLAPKTTHTILHIPLDLSVLAVIRPRPLIEIHRALDGHLHYFVRETALALLADAGMEVVDDFFTHAGGQLTGLNRKGRALQRSQRVLAAFSPTLAARTLGGFSLLVLARTKPTRD